MNLIININKNNINKKITQKIAQNINTKLTYNLRIIT